MRGKSQRGKRRWGKVSDGKIARGKCEQTVQGVESMRGKAQAGRNGRG